jgi:DegV family protein with EDD domain
MSGVAVVTDTTHGLPAELVRARGIYEVSLYVNWPDCQEREGEMESFDAFYDRLRTAKQLPTTSQPSVGDFLAVYEPLVAQGLDVVSIHLSGGISGTVESARQAAAQLHEGRVRVVDSATAAGGQGLVVLAAAAAARAGKGAEACVAQAQEARDGLKLWFAIDTFEFLVRGGRVGKAQGMVGSALKIKPILSIESEIVPVERVRTASRAFDRADGWVVQHIQAEEQAQRLVDAGREVFGTEPAFVSEIGPVLGAHAGPGLLGAGATPARLLV